MALGVARMEKRNIDKAALLYDEIDRNEAFIGTVNQDDRSFMNATFLMADNEKDYQVRLEIDLKN